MKVVIRADASLKIGTGHVMRCLTLASALKKKGAQVEFICREHEGNLIDHIEQLGFKTYVLPRLSKTEVTSDEDASTEYGLKWLGSTQQQDAVACLSFLEEIKPEWLIVDHYSLDKVWQGLLKNNYAKLMVIDDLANREHLCDLLLDQTYGRQTEDYAGLVPQQSKLLLGSEYALLRPEFAEWRDYSLQRRVNPEFKTLLITMGGVDADNVTGALLDILKTSALPEELAITVVMGGTAPHLEKVKAQAKLMPYITVVKVSINNMAEIMANADIAIGAAGATTWERCCLGLPSIQVVLAGNQQLIALLLSQAGGALCLNVQSLPELYDKLLLVRGQSAQLTKYSAALVNGNGVLQVLRNLI